MDENSSQNQPLGQMDNTKNGVEKEDDEIAIPIHQHGSRDHSTPLPVPSDGVVHYRNGRRIPGPINTDSGLLVNEDATNSRSSFLSEDGDNQSRRTSVGAESGYYGSPYGTRPMSSINGLPYSPSFSPSYLSTALSFQFNSSSSPSYLLAPQRNSGGQQQWFFTNFAALPNNPSFIPNQTSSPGSHHQRDEIEHHGVRPPENDDGSIGSGRSRAPSGGHNFRSIGTQTFHPNFDDDLNSDEDGDFMEFYEPGADDVFNEEVDNDDPFVPSQRGLQQLAGPLPDVIPECSSARPRNRAHSVSFPLSHDPSSPEDIGRCLKLVATDFDMCRSARSHSRQVAEGGATLHTSASYPGERGGFLAFLRSSFRSRRRQRSQSASEAPTTPRSSNDPPQFQLGADNGSVSPSSTASSSASRSTQTQSRDPNFL